MVRQNNGSFLVVDLHRHLNDHNYRLALEVTLPKT
jgi:hypothetical protein